MFVFKFISVHVYLWTLQVRCINLELFFLVCFMYFVLGDMANAKIYKSSKKNKQNT